MSRAERQIDSKIERLIESTKGTRYFQGATLLRSKWRSVVSALHEDDVENNNNNNNNVDDDIKEPGQTVEVTKRSHVNNNERTGQPWVETKFLQMYQDMRELEKIYNVKISVPEFLFFGFQSSGKTSTLSVVSGIPAGTMKDGTGTRCPVRYTMYALYIIYISYIVYYII